MEHHELVSAPAATQTGALTINSPVVTGLATPALAGAVGVSGTGIRPGTYVLTVDSSSQVTLSATATVAGPQALTFALEPVALAEAKLHLRIDADFLRDDPLLVGLLPAARVMAETMAHESFLAATYDWFFDGFPEAANGYFNRLIRQAGPGPQWLPNGAAILRVPKPPLVSVASIKYYDPAGVQQTVDPASYFVSSGMGSRVQPLIGQVWPVLRPQIDGCVVRHTSGLADASQVRGNVKAAIKLILGHLYEDREATVSASIGSKTLALGVESLLGCGDGWSYA